MRGSKAEVVVCGCFLVSYFALSSLAYGQAYYHREVVRAAGLPFLTAPSPDRSDVLLTSLDTIFHDRAVCCGEESALGDSARAADPTSLRDIAERLQGSHLLSNGHVVTVAAKYERVDEVNSGDLISMLEADHAPLLEWDSHLYVVQGVTFLDWNDSRNVSRDIIRKFLLLDTRYVDARRDVALARGSAEWSKAEGMLFLTATLQ